MAQGFSFANLTIVIVIRHKRGVLYLALELVLSDKNSHLYAKSGPKLLINMSKIVYVLISNFEEILDSPLYNVTSNNLVLSK
ncbi:hypothetical protein MTR_8g024220 [Medicago truncatula]|uniref:Uncharacterized protein n=1 Tax=Medicago truncatula TaxID=3880 RepID=A0A072TM24_MEDTR|nr:hypothetical protein MTR_8g024220 [Medicago truncatula]